MHASGHGRAPCVKVVLSFGHVASYLLVGKGTLCSHSPLSLDTIAIVPLFAAVPLARRHLSSPILARSYGIMSGKARITPAEVCVWHCWSRVMARHGVSANQSQLGHSPAATPAQAIALFDLLPIIDSLVRDI